MNFCTLQAMADHSLESALSFITENFARGTVSNNVLKHILESKDPAVDCVRTPLVLGEKDFPLDEVVAGRTFRWWTSKYFSWFVVWSVDAFCEIEKEVKPWKMRDVSLRYDLRAQLSQAGSKSFSRDQNGNGHTFIPGLFFPYMVRKSVWITGSGKFAKGL
jgi:hypothetical protein